MQYTIRNVPAALDNALREWARKEKKSLNSVVLQALARAMGYSAREVRYRDLGDLAGSWQEDPDFDSAVTAQDRIDEDLWR